MRLAACGLICLAALAALLFIKKQPHEEDLSYPVTESKPFVVIVPTYNDEDSVEATLFSIYQQRYDNYRVLLIDDHSRDQTLSRAKRCIAYFKAQERTTLIAKTEHSGTLASLYSAIHSCLDEEIATVVLGGDLLASPSVLATLNKAYADPVVWLTYGNSLNYPSYQKSAIKCRKISAKTHRNRLYRKRQWSCPPPYSFYAALFKEIPIADLFYRGRFYAMGWEQAVGLPLLEFASHHAKALDTPLYLYSTTSTKRDEEYHPSFQRTCHSHIRSRTPHRPLAALPHHLQRPRDQADLLILSEDRPMQLFALLESVYRHCSDIDRITVYYTASTQPYEMGYSKLKRAFPGATFLKREKDLQAQLLNTGLAPSYSSSPYVVLATDGVVVCDRLNLSEATSQLEKTQAYGIYFDLHSGLRYCAKLRRYQPIPISTPLVNITTSTPHLRAWQFSHASDDWNDRSGLDFALFKKEKIASLLAQIEFDNLVSLQYQWNLAGANDEAVGLHYTSPRCIRLQPPANPTGELEKFLSGLTIDLSALFQLRTPSKETAIKLSYTSRE